MWQLKAKIERKDANNMSEEQVKKCLDDENINQAIRDCVLWEEVAMD
jgi:hypothetical protein